MSGKYSHGYFSDVFGHIMANLQNVKNHVSIYRLPVGHGQHNQHTQHQPLHHDHKILSGGAEGIFIDLGHVTFYTTCVFLHGIIRPIVRLDWIKTD